MSKDGNDGQSIAREMEQDIGLTAAICSSSTGLIVAGLGGEWLAMSLFVGAPLVGAWATLRVRRALKNVRLKR